MSYLIDSDILIYFFNGVVSSEQLDGIFLASFNLSVVSRIEFLGWSGFAGNRDLNAKAREFMHHATIYDLDCAIADKTIEIRRENRIKVPDAVIAATALTYGHVLVTNNEDDFRSLGMEMFNPMAQ